MKKTILLFVLTYLCSTSLLASDYAIQLESSKNPQLSRFKQVATLGKLYTEPYKNGYIRTRLGLYNSKAQALKILESVHHAGFSDAFIVYEKDAVASSKHTAVKAQHDMDSFDVKTLPEWAELTPEQQKNIVYLDGVLHIKNGNHFTPLKKLRD